MSNQTGRTTRTTRSKQAPTMAVLAPANATKSTRTMTKAAPATTVPTATKRTTTRKPLSSRENSVTPSDASSKSKSKPASTRRAAKPTAVQDSDREPITAYLRIRPYLGDEQPTATPYLAQLSDTTVRMTDVQDNPANPARFRTSAISGSSLYTFSHIFPPETIQSQFFTRTTLPLVRDVLQGQNGLLFAYGVTNSGKTYTVQGGTSGGSAGILPRTLDVIFNSIEGLQGDGKYQPVRLYGIEPSDASVTNLPQISNEPALAEVLGQLEPNPEIDPDTDPTAVAVDRNYEYTVWISYVEIYNEKVYDLLDSIKDESSQKAAPKSTADLKLLLTRKALPLRPSPASDNDDVEVNGKYIAGLRQFRVTSAAQAKSIVKLGQLHRRVFGTLANHQSSRSHGMVIIKVVRGHRGERDDPTALQVSRLTLVDLAGSERTKHTHTTGERLKEAGNINKSLMVLGQCMEVMRSNQKKLAVSLAHDDPGGNGRMDTRDVRKTLAVVPFRHSKLTEVLMDYFASEGRVVMIVNVNPCDTGFDENSHVMKFAALAKEVYVTNAPAPVHKLPAIVPGKLQGQKFKDLNPLTINDPDVNPNPLRRKVTITMGKKRETVLEVVEEDEPADEADGYDDEPMNPLIDALFDEVENLRLQLFEAEMRCALIEAETREEVMREMEGRMRTMEEKYSRRLMNEFEQNELKTDAKIDMLHKAGLFNSPVKPQRHMHIYSDEDDEDAADVEMSLMNHDVQESEESEEDSRYPDDDDEILSASPLTRKSAPKGKITQNVAKNVPRKRTSDTAFSSEQEDANQGDAKHTRGPEEKRKKQSLPESEAEEVDETDEEEEEEEEEYVDDGDDSYDDDWKPPVNSSSKTRSGKRSVGGNQKQSPPNKGSTKSKKSRVSKLERDMEELSLKDDSGEDTDEPAIVAPKKSVKAKKIIINSGSEEEQVDVVEKGGENVPQVPPAKKKRQLGKKPVVTIDNIEKVTWEVEKKVAKTQGNRTIRRLTGK